MNPKALVRAVLAAVAALVALGVAACVIGPKQDDPASDLTATPSDDAASADSGTMGGAFDTDGASDAIATPSDTGSGDVGTAADSATEDATPDGCALDASDAGDASEAGCPTADASSDGMGADVLGGD